MMSGIFGFRKEQSGLPYSAQKTLELQESELRENEALILFVGENANAVTVT